VWERASDGSSKNFRSRLLEKRRYGPSRRSDGAAAVGDSSFEEFFKFGVIGILNAYCPLGADGQGKKTPLQRAASVTLLRIQCKSIKNQLGSGASADKPKGFRKGEVEDKVAGTR